MYITKGNSKLGKNVYHFSIPIDVSCQPTKWCYNNCYAKKGRFIFGAVKRKGFHNWKLVKSPNFVPTLISEIQKVKPKLFRIHIYGDFFSKEYIAQWKEIVKANPDTQFLAYSRRKDLVVELEDLNSLPNINIYESVDDSRQLKRMPNFKTAAVVPSLWQQQLNTAVTCPQKCEPCGHICWSKDQPNILFHQH